MFSTLTLQKSTADNQLQTSQNPEMLQTASRNCSTSAVHKHRHGGINHTPKQHHLSQARLLQRVGGNAKHSDVSIPPSASVHQSVLEGTSSTDRRQLLMGTVGGIVAASCQCCSLSPALANEWAYGETCQCTLCGQ